MNGTIRRGRCLCGGARFIARGEPKWVAHCHCESCRRATGAAFATYAGYVSDAVEWTGAKLSTYESSPGVTRGFCSRCGSPMSFVGERWPDEVHLFVASLEEPQSLTPTAHIYCETQLSWIHLPAESRRYAKTAREGPPLK